MENELHSSCDYIAARSIASGASAKPLETSLSGQSCALSKNNLHQGAFGKQVAKSAALKSH